MTDQGNDLGRGEINHLASLIAGLTLVFLLAVVASGCDGGSGGGGIAPQAPLMAALVVGSASGPIYDQLAAVYHITEGNGSEASTAFDLLIYDGNTVSAGDIETLPATANFLFTGRILVVLNPTQADREALESLTGASDLGDAPALALFNAYSNDGLLQSVNMVEFPTSLNEDPVPADSGDSASEGGEAQISSAAQVANPDEATLRAQTDQWRKLYESKYAEARQTFGSLSGVTPAQFATAAADDGATSALLSADSTTSNMDLTDFLAPSPELLRAQGSQFLTAQPFFDYKPYLLNLQSIYFQPRFNEDFYFKKAITPQKTVPRIFCPFLPYLVQFIGTPVTTPTNVNIEIATYYILQKLNGGMRYSHEIIARHWIQSVPNISNPSQSPVTERVNYCYANRRDRQSPIVCYPDSGGCDAFFEDHPLSSLRGFNAEISSSYSWDATSTPLLTLLSTLPEAVNKETSVKTSQSYDRTVSWSIQGAVKADAGIKSEGGTSPKISPNVGVSFKGSYGQNEKWSWSQDQVTTIKDWEVTVPLEPRQASNFVFFAQTGMNNLANLQAFATPPADPDNPPPLSFDPASLTDLQKGRLVQRDESDWSSKFHGLLPAARATLNAVLTVNYGEVYNMYTLPPGLIINEGLYTYGTLHPFTIKFPIGIDFSAALMRPPLPATWEISTELNTTAINGYFPITGTVTLDHAIPINTTLLLGAQLEPSGTTFVPTASVIQTLPLNLVIPAGQTSATFTANARRVGSPYNVQFYAFQTQGEVAGDGGQTVPAD